jgi:uncharacterized protein YfdQ (DUF2303 family)
VYSVSLLESAVVTELREKRHIKLETKRVRFRTTTTTTTMTKKTTTIKRKTNDIFVPMHTSRGYGG